MILKLSGNNTLVVPVMAWSTESDTIGYIYSKFRIFIVSFYMMSNKGFFATARVTPIVVFIKNLFSPCFIGVSITPFLIACRNTVYALFPLSSNYLNVSSFVRAYLRTKSPNLESRSSRIVRFTTPLTIFICTVLGHQSEFNKIKEYSQ